MAVDELCPSVLHRDEPINRIHAAGIEELGRCWGGRTCIDARWSCPARRLQRLCVPSHGPSTRPDVPMS